MKNTKEKMIRQSKVEKSMLDKALAFQSKLKENYPYEKIKDLPIQAKLDVLIMEQGIQEQIEGIILMIKILENEIANTK